MNAHNTADVKIREVKELLPRIAHLYELPISDAAADLVHQTRQEIADLVHGRDKRLLLIIGPCSIHDPEAALEYARKLLPLRKKYEKELLIVMRVYFEKPRTTVGWKGLINDPHLDGTFDINFGLRQARRLLLALNDMGMPASTEFLDMITPQYYADLISWAPSARAPPKAKCTASWPAAFPAPWALKTAPTATSKSPSMPSAPPATRTTFYRSPKPAIPLLCTPSAKPTAT